ncbi:MAG: hypothetical protein ACM3S1_00400 [Hyphomicrobiales bacterium]
MADYWLIGLAASAAFAANAAPAFSPANWMVMTAFRIAGAPVVPLGVAGAGGAALGRGVLAWATRSASRRWLPASQQANAEALTGRLAALGEKKLLLFIAAYSWSPLPSNVLFIAIGAGEFSIRRAAAVFFACRLISDTFWAWLFATTGKDALRTLLDGWISWRSLALQVLSLVVVVAVFRLPWARWLGQR